MQEHDAYSGDYGLGFFGSSLETGSTFVLHESLGALCYLCDFAPTSTDIIHNNNKTGTIGSSNDSSASNITRRSTGIANASLFPSTIYTIVPRDAYKQRLFIEPLGE
jgi:hypothetical protein